jgi:hypothetical protein
LFVSAAVAAAGALFVRPAAAASAEPGSVSHPSARECGYYQETTGSPHWSAAVISADASDSSDDDDDDDSPDGFIVVSPARIDDHADSVPLTHVDLPVQRVVDPDEHALRGPPAGLDADAAIDDDDDDDDDQDDDSYLELTPSRRSVDGFRLRVRIGLGDDTPFQFARSGRSLRAPPQ